MVWRTNGWDTLFQVCYFSELSEKSSNLADILCFWGLMFFNKYSNKFEYEGWRLIEMYGDSWTLTETDKVSWIPHQHSSRLMKSLSRLIKTHQDSSRLIQTHQDSLRLIETHRGSSRLIETHRDSLRLIETHWDSSRLINSHQDSRTLIEAY